MNVRPSNVVTMRQITVNINYWIFSFIMYERWNVVTMRQITVNNIFLAFQSRNVMYETTMYVQPIECCYHETNNSK